MTPCIEHTQAYRYGRTRRNGQLIGLHTAALWDATGEPPNGRQTLHHCDNHKCINPDHLYYGDHAQNMRDRAERNRIPPDKRRKLPSEAVCRARHGESIDVLAKAFSVTRTAIYNARSGATYREVQCLS